MKLPFDVLAPKALWLLALLPPLILLYILKVKRTTLRVASTWLWAQARRDLMARSPFKRLVVQLLTESILLATLGGLAGLIAARWTLDLIVSLLGHEFGPNFTVDFNPPIPSATYQARSDVVPPEFWLPYEQ